MFYVNNNHTSNNNYYYNDNSNYSKDNNDIHDPFTKLTFQVFAITVAL